MENTYAKIVRGGGTARKGRDSNLELYRIVVMLLIIAHHYVANSGLVQLAMLQPTAPKNLFLFVFSAFGKPGINCFMLITGYFMCTSNISAKKYAKLLLQLYFYRIVFYLIFLLTGYEPFSIKSFARMILPLTGVASGFVGCFLLFYLMIPFLNILIRSLTEKQHILLLALCLTIYTLIGTVPFFTVNMNYVSWFCVLYLIAAYIRLYPRTVFANIKLWGWATVANVLLAVASVVVCAWLGKKLSKPYLTDFFVSDSNKILALTVGVTSFLFFKNLRVPQSKVINAAGGATFGVLLVHAISPTMRQWLWVDFLKNVEMYNSPLLYLHAVGSVLGIFVVACIIELLRVKFIEKPFFAFWDKHYEAWKARCGRVGQAICKRMNIQ